MKTFEEDIQQCIKILNSGGLILYPTDTIWGIGCDATNEIAVKKVYDLKKREDSKSMIVLIADERDILKYVAAPDLQVLDFLAEQNRPTTIIFDHAISLAENVIASDGSIGIRIVKDEFRRHLIKRFQKPVVSTSANISGTASPITFNDVQCEIKEGVDYVVRWRQDDATASQPSQVIKWRNNGDYEVIRR